MEKKEFSIEAPQEESSAAFCSTQCQVPCSCFTIEDIDHPSDPQLGDLEPQTSIMASKNLKGSGIEIISSAIAIDEEDTIPKEIEEFTEGDRVVAFITTDSIWRNGTIMKMKNNQPEILIDGWTKTYPFEVFKKLPYEPGTYITNDWVTTRDGMNISSSERVGRIEAEEKIDIIEITYDDKHKRFRGKTAEGVWLTIKNEKTGTRFLRYHVEDPISTCDWCLTWYIRIASTIIILFTVWNLYENFTSDYGFQCYSFWLCWLVMEIEYYIEELFYVAYMFFE